MTAMAGVCGLPTRLIRLVSRLLFDAIPACVGEIGVGTPIAATDLSEPEPDLAVFPPSYSYRRRHPRQASLLFEVSDTSLCRDLAIKSRIYARAGVPDYWVVDLVDRLVIVHRDPRGDAYAEVTGHTDGVIRALRHSQVAIDVDALLG